VTRASSVFSPVQHFNRLAFQTLGATMAAVDFCPVMSCDAAGRAAEGERQDPERFTAFAVGLSPGFLRGLK
jgi:hypothetical protein